MDSSFLDKKNYLKNANLVYLTLNINVVYPLDNFIYY